MSGKKFRIIIPEALGDEGLRILREAGDVDADIRTGIARADLLKIIEHYDAIIKKRNHHGQDGHRRREETQGHREGGRRGG